MFLQWLLGYPMTTAVIIGYIALFAVAIQTGIIMIIFIRRALARRTENESYMDAVLDGSVLRLRPKLMTVAVTVLSLLPIMFSTGLGMEIMKPIATPTIGGMLTSTIYVLFLIPCLFAIGARHSRREAAEGGMKFLPPVAVALLAAVPSHGPDAGARCAARRRRRPPSSIQGRCCPMIRRRCSCMRAAITAMVSSGSRARAEARRAGSLGSNE